MSLGTHVTLALHLLGCVGFVVVVSMGKLTERLRHAPQWIVMGHPRVASFYEGLIRCAMCFGVWGGSAWAVALLLRFLGLTPAWLDCAHDVMAFAFATSLLGFLVAVVAESKHGSDAPPRP